MERYGYDEIEFAGYTQGSAGPITLAQLKKLAHDHGLNPIGSHVGYYSSDPNAYTFAQNLTKVLDDAEALGLKHIGTASGPFRYGSTVDGWKRAAEDFNTYGEAARARGMKFYQHNHAEEFSFATDKPSVRLYDVLLAETDPDHVFLEMDIYWAYSAQFRFGKQVDGTPRPFDPLDYVLKRPHRYPLFHVKDIRWDPAGPRVTRGTKACPRESTKKFLETWPPSAPTTTSAPSVTSPARSVACSGVPMIHRPRRWSSHASPSVPPSASDVAPRDAETERRRKTG